MALATISSPETVRDSVVVVGKKTFCFFASAGGRNFSFLEKVSGIPDWNAACVYARGKGYSTDNIVEPGSRRYKQIMKNLI